MAPAAAPRQTRQKLLDIAGQMMARKGFRAVGLSEVLSRAGVPKGSFYHYFESKDAFGHAIMQDYFASYLAHMDSIMEDIATTAPERLMRYFEDFRMRQSADDFQGGCLVVKFGPEVSNLSESMRGDMTSGVGEILDRLERVIAEGVADGSMASPDPRSSAEILYDMWVGASVVAKISRDPATFDTTTMATRQLLKMKEPNP